MRRPPVTQIQESEVCTELPGMSAENAAIAVAEPVEVGSENTRPVAAAVPGGPPADPSSGLGGTGVQPVVDLVVNVRAGQMSPVVHVTVYRGDVREQPVGVFGGD